MGLPTSLDSFYVAGFTTVSFSNMDALIKVYICIYIYIYIYIFSQVGSVFANGPGGLGPIPGRVIPKTLKMVLDTTLLNTQEYMVRIKGKVEQPREMSSALPR